MDPVSVPPAGVAFGRFQLLPDRRELLADGRPVKLGGRAFDVLMALIEARGAVVSKDALMARVWLGRTVEENSLAAQIAALRAAFGAERELIRTVSGRGYQFTGEIRTLSASPEKAAAGVARADPGSILPPTNIPEPVSDLIGRDEDLGEILNLAAARRLVTLIGAGGIGKTTLALALARELRPHFADGVWLAEFSALADPGLVPATVAAAVGLDLGGGEASAERVAQALAGRRLLLVLDTCEHVIDAAAAFAEAALGAGSELHIIATSREPFRAGGEWVYPVQPLAVPATDAAANDDLLRYGAVRLFIERGRASGALGSEDRHVAPTVAVICRQLDGIPLAIELAAARAATLGIEDLAARLSDCFQLLTGGRRTALPRHQTLLATHDWSYELLAAPERVLLRRLAIFAGPFSLEAATAVAISPELSAPDAVEGLTSLVAKSLVAAETEGPVARYRLLDTTRAYALGKLEETGEHEQVARRHAEYYRDLFQRAEAESDAQNTAEWHTEYADQIANLRVALDRAFSPGGDSLIGVALTVAALPLWVHLSLMGECRRRVEEALSALMTQANQDLRPEMKLSAALGASLLATADADTPETGAAWTRTLDIAVRLEDPEYQLRALSGLCIFHINSGQPHFALGLALRFCSLAASKSDFHDQQIGERLIGASHHLLGNQSSARDHFERSLADEVRSDGRSDIIRFQIDKRSTRRVYLARILWLLGFVDQAMSAAHCSVEEARAANHAVTLCHALARAACPLAVSVGDLATAEYYAGMLVDHSERHGLPRWRAFGHGYQGILHIGRGSRAIGVQLLRAAFDETKQAGTAFRFMPLMGGEVPEALGRSGQIAEGLALIDEELDRSEHEHAKEHWRTAELLRVKGELALLQAAQGAAATAENYFRQALDWARWQGALSWELRATTSLARLWRDQGRFAEALALLQPAYDRFTEGFDTADLKAAKALLDGLR